MAGEDRSPDMTEFPNPGGQPAWQSPDATTMARMRFKVTRTITYFATSEAELIGQLAPSLPDGAFCLPRPNVVIAVQTGAVTKLAAPYTGKPIDPFDPF